jgi:hypothetical protein
MNKFRMRLKFMRMKCGSLREGTFQRGGKHWPLQCSYSSIISNFKAGPSATAASSQSQRHRVKADNIRGSNAVSRTTITGGVSADSQEIAARLRL